MRLSVLIAFSILLAQTALASPWMETLDATRIVVGDDVVGTVESGARVERWDGDPYLLDGLEVWPLSRRPRLGVQFCDRAQQLGEQPVYVAGGDRLELLGIGSRARVRAVVHPYDDARELAYDGELDTWMLCAKPIHGASRLGGPFVPLKAHRIISLRETQRGRILFSRPPDSLVRTATLVERRSDAMRIALGPGPALLGWIRREDALRTEEGGAGVIDAGGTVARIHRSLIDDDGSHPLHRIVAGTEITVQGVRVARLVRDGIGRVLAREGATVKVMVSPDARVVVTGWIPATAVREQLEEWRVTSGLDR